MYKPQPTKAMRGGASFWQRSEDQFRESAQKAAEWAERITNSAAKKVQEKTSQKGGAAAKKWWSADNLDDDQFDDEAETEEEEDDDEMVGGSFSDYVAKGKAGVKKLQQTASKGLADAASAIVEAQKLVGGSAEDHVRRDLDRQIQALQHGGRAEWEQYMSGGGVIDDAIKDTKKMARKVETNVRDGFSLVKRKMTGGANLATDDGLRADLAFQSTMLDQGGLESWNNYMKGGGCCKKRTYQA